MSKLNSQPSPFTLTLLSQSNNQVASPYFNLKATFPHSLTPKGKVALPQNMRQHPLPLPTPPFGQGRAGEGRTGVKGKVASQAPTPPSPPSCLPLWQLGGVGNLEGRRSEGLLHKRGERQLGGFWLLEEDYY